MGKKTAAHRPKKSSTSPPKRHFMVGDIQGCLSPLKALLKRVAFDPKSDELWCVGDLVNRGPESLETLRFIMALGSSAIVVLGNHDLNLLATLAGTRPLKKKDAVFLQPILEAAESEDIMHWLRQQPLIHVDHDLKLVMTHAGLPHTWSLKDSVNYAKEVEKCLTSKSWRHFLNDMYGNSPTLWDKNLKGHDRLRCIVNYLTRMRFIAPDGQLEFDSKESPDRAPAGFAPWFQYHAPDIPYSIIFGHWAALMGITHHPDRIALDTGCVWGNHMTLLHWETGKRYTASL